MMMPVKIPNEIQDEALKAGVEELRKYAESESTTNSGSTLRKIANIIAKVLPFFKFIKFNRNANTK